MHHYEGEIKNIAGENTASSPYPSPPRALATYRVLEAIVQSLLRRSKQKQRGLLGLLCRRPSITEWEMYITAQGPRLRNDLYRLLCRVGR